MIERPESCRQFEFSECLFFAAAKLPSLPACPGCQPACLLPRDMLRQNRRFVRVQRASLPPFRLGFRLPKSSRSFPSFRCHHCRHTVRPCQLPAAAAGQLPCAMRTCLLPPPPPCLLPPPKAKGHKCQCVKGSKGRLPALQRSGEPLFLKWAGQM